MNRKISNLPFAPSEDPFKVENGGFYRRWFSMIDDIDLLKKTVSMIDETYEDIWVPIWKKNGLVFEKIGDDYASKGNIILAKKNYLQAKTYYSIGRFPEVFSELKKDIHNDCIRAFKKAVQWNDPPVQSVEIKHQGKSINCFMRTPKLKEKVPAVLIMCGSDVFKEDRIWACDMAIENDMAALVMDAPGTAENPLPWEPESVSAWIAAIDFLASLDKVDEKKIGAFGISRGGYSVLQLAGSYNKMVKAVVANGGHPLGYQMSGEELSNFVKMRNKRSNYIFGKKDGPLTFPKWSVDHEYSIFKKWSLSELGLLKNIVQPALLINGKQDHLNPIGNINFFINNAPIHGKESMIFADAGHCAFKYFQNWAPYSFKWLKNKLSNE
tara:strand:- start:2406 stop:3551 length:1146 start_codon:yes stop_codon:yes gene_type:complete